MTLIGRTAVLSNINCSLSCPRVCKRRFDGKCVLAKVVPNALAIAMLVQRAALDQSAEMLLQRIAAGSSQFDRFTNRDEAMLAGKFDNL